MNDKNWKTVRTPAKRAFRYEVDDCRSRFEFTSNYVSDTETGRRWLAEEAEEDFFHNHDGWEGKWPVGVFLYDGDEFLGCFSVDVEMQPAFHATRHAAD